MGTGAPLNGPFMASCFFYAYCIYSRHQKKIPVPFFIPFRFVLFRSVHFRSNRLPRANSFSARHEFVCKIHCVCWRSIARLFSTTRSRDGFFLP